MTPRRPKQNKINTVYCFTVEGNGPFPIDMIRHDRCWPASQEQVTALAPHSRSILYGEPRRVELRSHSEPNEGRWRSFQWQIVEQHALDVSS